MRTPLTPTLTLTLTTDPGPDPNRKPNLTLPLPLPLPLIQLLCTAASLHKLSLCAPQHCSVCSTAGPLHPCTSAPLHPCTPAPLHPCTLHPCRYMTEMRALSTKPWEGQDLNAFGKLGDGDTAVAIDSRMHHVRFAVELTQR